MGFAPGAAKPPSSGRTKSRGNLTTQSVRDAFRKAFDQAGGAVALVRWALASDDNLTEFYKLCARLLPTRSPGLIAARSGCWPRSGST